MVNEFEKLIPELEKRIEQRASEVAYKSTDNIPNEAIRASYEILRGTVILGGRIAIEELTNILDDYEKKA